MKKQAIALVALAGMAMGASLAYGAAGSNGGGIVGSKHDMNVFQAGTVKDKDGRVCAFCHTPHHAQGTDATATIDYNDASGTAAVMTYRVYSPLWSRQAINVTPEYKQYASASFNPAALNDAPYDNLIGPSRLCMTCHDGVIGVDSYYGESGKALTTKGDDGQSMFGDNHFAVGGVGGLSNDHPIGMRYADFLGKDYNGTSYELQAVNTPFGTTGKKISDVLFTDPLGGEASGFVTCASCHDVHNGKEVGNTSPLGSGRGYFLRETQTDSKFCIVCHDKNS